MPKLQERLEVRLDPELMAQVRREAERRGMSMAQLVREALQAFFREEDRARLQAAEALFRVGAPVDDWPALEREIKEAYGR